LENTTQPPHGESGSPRRSVRTSWNVWATPARTLLSGSAPSSMKSKSCGVDGASSLAAAAAVSSPKTVPVLVAV